MIAKDLLDEWRNYEVSGQVIEAMEKARDELLKSMEWGHFVNPSNMEETFGMSAKAAGVMEGLNKFFNIIGGQDED